MDLEQARKLVLENNTPTHSLTRPLYECLGLVTAEHQYALQPNPCYTQATRDGFVISKSLPSPSGKGYCFKIIGEIAAGDEPGQGLGRGVCCRIMTGGLIPKGGWKVLPQEFCDVDGDHLLVDPNFLIKCRSNLQKKGSDYPKGKKVVASGSFLTPAHLSLIADSGIRTVKVHSPPTVSFFCSGSELVDKLQHGIRGKKISSNRHLLMGLISYFGGVPQDHGSVDDELQSLGAVLKKVVENKPNIIISTGGMGPGKYDLLTESFIKAGGKIIFSKLNLRPGKSVLFGKLGETLYFGLPGPPPAVQTLFHLLIRPAILKMQNIVEKKGGFLSAILTEDIENKKGGVLKFVEAKISDEKEKRVVRRISKHEISNCYLRVPARRKQLKKDERVQVLLQYPQPF